MILDLTVTPRWPSEPPRASGPGGLLDIRGGLVRRAMRVDGEIVLAEAVWRGEEVLLRAHAARQIGLVTCDWHMPRALRLFRPLGLDLTALPAQAPARPLAVRGARWLRERASLTLDLAVLRLHLEL